MITIPQPLWNLIQQCWQQDPRLRPTATTIAEKLQDLIVCQNQPTPFAIASELEVDPASGSNSRAKQVIHGSLALVEKARKGTSIPLRKLSAADFHILLSDSNSWGPANYFVAGAVIWWRLVDESIYEMGNGLISSLPLSANG